jgi:porin
MGMGGAQMRSQTMRYVLLGTWLLLAIAGHCAAQDKDLLHRDRLTGNWGGERTKLEENGVSLQVDWTDYLDGIAAGDGPGGTFNGGHLYSALNFDGTRAKFIDGFSVDIALEGHYGPSVNDRTGTVMPPIFAMNAIRAGNSVWGVTLLKVTQQLGHGWSVYAGKTTPLYGYRNEFMDGLGRTKFENTAFVAKPGVGGVVAYSAWAVGANWNIIPSAGPHDQGTWLKFYVQDTNMTATRLGLDTLFDNGATLFGELDFSTRIFDLPGNHVINVAWSNRKRTSLDIHQAIILPEGGIVPGTKDSAWAVWYSMDQYLHVNADDPERGWGVFGKIEFSDGNPNPIKLIAASGFGGTGPFDARPRDRWGIGFYFLNLSSTLENSLKNFVDLRREWGVENFYNLALTPAVSLSADAQVLRPATSEHWQTVLGLRLNIKL